MAEESKSEPKTPDALFSSISDEIENLPEPDKEVSAILKKHFLKNPIEKNAVGTALQALIDLAKQRVDGGESGIVDND